MNKLLALFAISLSISSAALADEPQLETKGYQNCRIPSQTVRAVQSELAAVVKLSNGGIFAPNRMWSAVVDRSGTLCSVEVIGDAWPGSRAIAIAKASTANDFSNSGLSLSTANLYAATQPGGSLYGLNNSNPFNPDYNKVTTGSEWGSGVGHTPGGIITFGGGMALYSNGKVIGGLGVSGDTSCTDHVIAYRMRRAAHLDGIPGGANSSGTDNIEYPIPSTAAPTGFQQPHCLKTDIPPGNI